MLAEFKKSVSSLLYERVASPLYGALFLSWVTWNWKIFYLTFFINEENINKDKITYIVDNFSNIHNLVTLPLVSTFLLLTVVPFITNGAFWLHLNFNKWKIDKKHEVEKQQLLTLEQSIELRAEIANSKKQFEVMISGKNSEIESLKLQLKNAKNEFMPDKPFSSQSKMNASNNESSAEEFKLFKDSGKLEDFIQKKSHILNAKIFNADQIMGIENAIAFELVERAGSGAKLTSKGKDFFKWVILTKDE